jgi:hypothetical protein
MRACIHYRRFGFRTELEPSENPWNAWIYVYDEHGNLYWSSFQAGLYWEYLEHLISNYECFSEITTGMPPVYQAELLCSILSQREQIEKEWAERTGGTLSSYE